MDEHGQKAFTHFCVTVVLVIFLLASCQIHRQTQRTIRVNKCLETDKSGYVCKAFDNDVMEAPRE